MARLFLRSSLFLLAVVTVAAAALPDVVREAFVARATRAQTAAESRVQPATAAARAYLFLSPNTEEDLSLPEAKRRLRSEHHARFRHLIQDILGEIGTGGFEVRDALGDWSDGVENSLWVALADAPDFDSLRYAAARFGSRAGQKSVLVCQVDARGADRVYELDVPQRDIAPLRQMLDGHGVRYRTLVPTAAGHRVVIFDEGGRLHANVRRLAHVEGARVDETRVRGVFLGEDSREQALQHFERIIRAYECSRSPTPVPPCLSRGILRRDGQPVEKPVRFSRPVQHDQLARQAA